jgi:hypothetical protein
VEWEILPVVENILLQMKITGQLVQQLRQKWQALCQQHIQLQFLRHEQITIQFPIYHENAAFNILSVPTVFNCIDLINDIINNTA